MTFGNLNFLGPSGPLQACNGTPLHLPFFKMQSLCYNDIEGTERIVSLKKTVALSEVSGTSEGKTQRDSKRWTQFRTSIFLELYTICE